MKLTKKLIAVILAAIMLFTLASCTTPADGSETHAETTGTPAADQKTVALDFTAEWNKVATEGSLAQGCLIVSRKFVEEHSAELDKFLEEYAASVAFVNENIDEAAEIIAAQGIIPKAGIAKKAIPKSNLVCVTGEDMKASLAEFYNILFTADKTSIGGSLPTDDFYYINNTSSDFNADATVKIVALSGTTGMGLAPLMDKADKGEAALKYDFEIVGTMTDAVIASITSGEVDIAAVPTNLAAKLFKKTNGNVQVIALNTLGVLYLLENGNTVDTVEDLEGKTIYVPGNGANPEYVTKHIVNANNLKNVTVDCTTYPTPDALAAAFSEGLIDFAVLPEPKVTIVMSK